MKWMKQDTTDKSLYLGSHLYSDIFRKISSRQEWWSQLTQSNQVLKRTVIFFSTKQQYTVYENVGNQKPTMISTVQDLNLKHQMTMLL